MNNSLLKSFHSQWKTMVEWVDMNLKELNDADLMKEIIPGKNHGIWILGHLIACEDDVSVYLVKGNYMFAEYQQLFGTGGKIQDSKNYPSPLHLRENWKKVCYKSNQVIISMSDEDLSKPHEMLKSESDYFKTKIKFLADHILHQMYHNGQFGLLLSMVGKNKY